VAWLDRGGRGSPRRGHQRHQGARQGPGLDAPLKGVARREFDIVAAWSVSRLGRSLPDLIGLLGELRSRDIESVPQRSLTPTRSRTLKVDDCRHHVPDPRRLRRTLRNLQSDALNCIGTSPGYAVGHLPGLNSNLIEIVYECRTCNRALDKDAPPVWRVLAAPHQIEHDETI
jgi:Resolvase, N terminal domain